MMKWEKVVAEGKRCDCCVLYLYLAELCGFYCCYSRKVALSVLFCVVAFSTGLQYYVY
jgi:hypothetical protein